jgi:hypothetical protein
MLRLKTAGLGLMAATLIAAPVLVHGHEACKLPGELVMEDAHGDDLLAPTGEGFGDIHSLHIAEPGGGGQMVFTYKMADLATVPPSTLWVLIFQTDVPPATGNENFVAMLTDPAGEVKFVYGTVAPADPSQPALRIFTPAGALADASTFDADGTITLVLEKAEVGGLEPGGFVFGMIPVTHRITPTDGTQPFTYGIRGLSAGVNLVYDDAPDGFYELVAEGACAGDGKSLLGVGALPWGTLALLMLAGLAGRRRQRIADLRD